ncbi:alpha/beta hydrolase family protein [Chitinophaga tropicalis]|uniref:Alpha/beta fold hydrolase n=1 Tax=Chitinophaga tropicalis TaxID=2683588 RepID=A0A7K1U2L1_9BACT|nr:alpha/beta hydrolase [Chitinophaga tropicalis]MVT08591.1 alpha/beta fold hydrolase [Chitinophaga tropicalis]
MKKLIAAVLTIPMLLPGLLFGQAAAYRSDSVHFSNADKSIRFGATLTIPANKKRFPAIVLVSGTGKQDRDGNMAGHPMFKVLADSLTRSGIAVLRIDDRGTGETNGTYETATTKDFADDALAAVAFLKTIPGISKVGLAGHSEGGAAAIIAAASSKDVAFVITLAGLAVRGIDALKLQNYAITRSAKISEYDRKRHDTINTRMFDTAYRYAFTPELESRLRNTYAEWKKADDSAYKKDFPDGYDHMRFFIESYVRNATGAWYQYHITFDPVPFLQKVRVPFLALNGDKDIMVTYKENLDMIANTLKQAGNKQVTTQVLPGINHLFQHCVTCTREESATLKEDFSPEAIAVIRKWLKEVIL